MDDECYLIVDVTVTVHNREAYSTKHFLKTEDEPFDEVVSEVLRGYARSLEDNVILSEGEEDDATETTLQGMHGRIKSVKCVGKSTELYPFLQRSNLPLKRLNSKTTPIFTNGLCIDLAPIKEKSLPVPKDKKKSLPSAFNVLMGKGDSQEIKYLLPPAEKESPKLNEQLIAVLIPLLNDQLGVGYYNITQKQCIEKNVLHSLVNTLCLFEKHWHKFLNVQFPSIPSGQYSGSLLLEALSKCKRAKTKKSSDPLTVTLLSTHIGYLSSLNWSPFKKATTLKDAIELLRNEIEIIRGILIKKKNAMIGRNSLFTQPTSSRDPSVFRNLPSYVNLDDQHDEFFVSIPRSEFNTEGRNKKKRGKVTATTIEIDKAITNLTTVLKYKNDYTPICLSDEQMGIVDEAVVEQGGTIVLESWERAYYRQEFKKRLVLGLDGVNINVFGRMRVGSPTPTCIFIWKVPLCTNDAHPGVVQKTIESCRQQLPKKIAAESLRHFNTIMSTLLDVPAGVRKALTNYLFMGEVNVTGDVANNYCKFVMDLSAGMPIDESLIIDGRTFNSRGGKEIGSTM